MYVGTGHGTWDVSKKFCHWFSNASLSRGIKLVLDMARTGEVLQNKKSRGKKKHLAPKDLWVISRRKWERMWVEHVPYPV